MNIKLPMCALMFAIFLGGMTLAHAQSEDVGDLAIVVQQNGAPLANTTLVVSSMASAVFDGMITTDSEGRALLSDVPVGAFDVRVLNADGSVAAEVTGELSGGTEPAELDIEL
jgi:hypothetical protein